MVATADLRICPRWHHSYRFQHVVPVESRRTFRIALRTLDLRLRHLLCGVGASLASIAWHPGTPSVGASGAIFGLAGALIAAFKLGEFSVPRSALSGTLRSLAMFVIYNLIFGQVIGTTDNAAHVGGLVTGLILGALIALIAPQHDHAMRRISIFIAMTALLAGAAVGLARYHGLPLRLGTRLKLHGRQSARPRNRATGEDGQAAPPIFFPAHFDLAQAYFNQSEYAQAETELKRVLDLKPKHAGARALLGMVYLNQNRPQDAKDMFTQLLTQDPDSAEGHYGLGLALAAEDNHQAAIEEYKTATRLDPQAAGIDYDLGVSYAKLKMYDDAVAAFLKERQNGDNHELEAALADAYQAKGLTQQAQESTKQGSAVQRTAKQIDNYIDDHQYMAINIRSGLLRPLSMLSPAPS